MSSMLVLMKDARRQIAQDEQSEPGACPAAACDRLRPRFRGAGRTTVDLIRMWRTQSDNMKPPVFLFWQEGQVRAGIDRIVCGAGRPFGGRCFPGRPWPTCHFGSCRKRSMRFRDESVRSMSEFWSARGV